MYYIEKEGNAMFEDEEIKIVAKYINHDDHANARKLALKKLNEGYNILGTRIDNQQYTISYILNKKFRLDDKK